MLYGIFDKIPSVGLKFSKSYKGNQAYIFKKSLDGEKYDPIRDTPEFMEICENLKIHAREEE